MRTRRCYDKPFEVKAVKLYMQGGKANARPGNGNPRCERLAGSAENSEDTKDF